MCRITPPPPCATFDAGGAPEKKVSESFFENVFLFDKQNGVNSMYCKNQTGTTSVQSLWH